MVLKFGALWAGIGMLLSFLIPDISTWAHGGGLATGIVLGALFGFKEERESGPGICLFALAAGIAVLASFSAYFFLPPAELQ